MEHIVDDTQAASTDPTATNIAVVEPKSPTSARSLRPRLASSNIYTTDVTHRFLGAAARLVPGTLVRDEQFTLFESVGALEIGDPKMDSGCVKQGESLEEDFDVCKLLLPEEVLWLMDELLSREVAWHMGYPLSQTLFTSTYIERLLWPDPTVLQEAQFFRGPAPENADPLLHGLFRSYCLGLIKSCDLFLNMVMSQHYFEEEDLATQLYNRELLHRFSVEEILSEMQSALSYLDDAILETQIKTSLEARINFRLHLLRMLSAHTSTNLSSGIGPKVDSSLLDVIQNTKNQGKCVSDAFTLKLQRRLASTVPPRPMVSIDEGRTFDYLKHFLRDCENVFSVLVASHSHDLLTSYSVFSSQDPQPSVYVRALLQSWLSREELTGDPSDHLSFLLDDLESITLAASPVLEAMRSDPVALAEPLRLVRQYVHDFAMKNGRSLVNILRTMGLNRCRIRRTLCHAAVEWDSIQAEAEELDDELQTLMHESAVTYPSGCLPTWSYSISSWVYHYKLIQLRLIAQMGFELEVYAPHERASMYWYLAHLCETHMAHLERITFFAKRRETGLASSSTRSNLESRSMEECENTLRQLYRHFSLLKATDATARALHGLYVVLQRHGQFGRPTTTYSSDSLRYELRMKPFSYLSIPEPIEFAQNQRRCLMAIRTDAEILDESASHATVAKNAWDEVLKNRWNGFPLRPEADADTARVIDDMWNTDIRNAARAAIGAGISTATLKSYLESEARGTLHVSVPQKGDQKFWHPWWPVPQISL